jgi:hypothetical protein
MHTHITLGRTLVWGVAQMGGTEVRTMAVIISLVALVFAVAALSVALRPELIKPQRLIRAESGEYYLAELDGEPCEGLPVHDQVPEWAWVDAPDVDPAARWAEQMDAVDHATDRDERWKALEQAHEAVKAAIRCPWVPTADDEDGAETWREGVDHAMRLCDAARDGWRWAGTAHLATWHNV